MRNDAADKIFFSDDARYADLINGLLCNGRQVLKKEDLMEYSGSVHIRTPKPGTTQVRSVQGYQNREELQDLSKDLRYQKMDEGAREMLKAHIKLPEELEMKIYEDEKMEVAKGFRDWAEEERSIGRAELFRRLCSPTKNAHHQGRYL